MTNSFLIKQSLTKRKEYNCKIEFGEYNLNLNE